MQEVIRTGTGRAARGLGRNLAGKTGTTNENTDAWFIGFSPDIVAGVWVGFDTPRPLGDKESAAAVALPIWIRYMGRALAQVPDHEFPVPPGITFARVDPATGKSLPPGSTDGVVLPFRIGTVPEQGPPSRKTQPGRRQPDDLL
jgi:penicillin-binding protein 1A